MKSKQHIMEEMLIEYFGCDPAYYSKQEVQEITRALEMGFSAKEKIIEETLKTLEQLITNINNLPLSEQIFKSRDLDRLNNKIEILKSLL